MTVTAYIFVKLETEKDEVNKLSKKSRFRKPLDSQHAKGPQRLLKSSVRHFYHIP